VYEFFWEHGVVGDTAPTAIQVAEKSHIVPQNPCVQICHVYITVVACTARNSVSQTVL